MKKRFVSMGLVLVVTALLVAMLAGFTLLSLSAARNDLARAQALAQNARQYYAACAAAEQVRLDLSRGDAPSGVELLPGDGAVSFRIPIGEGRSLLVSLREGSWEVLCWQTQVLREE